jgi:retinol dehydrogenase 14
LVWQGRKNLGVYPEVPSKTIVFLATDPAVQDSSVIYWHSCEPKQPSLAALDLKMAKRLWIESCRLCSLPIPVEGETK